MNFETIHVEGIFTAAGTKAAIRMNRVAAIEMKPNIMTRLG